jgi:hypothetical protein
MEKTEFTREKISMYCKYSHEYIESMSVIETEDIFVDMIIKRVDAFIATHMAETQILTYYCPRPTFFDWLFRREKKIEWSILIKDILKNPPRFSQVYVIDEGKYLDK